MKVAFHVINGVGLGHVVRAVTIARAVRELVPDVELLFLTNARDPSFIAAAGIDFVQLPPRLDEPHADPDRASTSLPRPLEEAALVAALDVFAPDLVVFDTHAPRRLVRHVTANGAGAVLVLRELRKEVLRSFVESGAAGELDRIVVPHEPGDMDLAPLAGLPFVLVGPVVRDIGRVDAAPSSSPASPASPLVVATAGGGGQPIDAARYLQAVVDAHALARIAIPSLETIVVRGPYGDAPPKGADVPGLTLVRSTADLPSLLARATLVVSQAGYNAIAELRSLAKPAILVPGLRKSEDQRARAMRLVRAKAAVLAKPEGRSIADRIEALVGSPATLAAMKDAHAAIPLVEKNRAAAEAALAPVWRRAPSGRRWKVVLVAHDFAPKHGGMETVASALASSLAALGVDVRVYTARRLGARFAAGLGEGVVEPLYLPLPPPGRIDLEADLHLTIDAAIRDQPDVIHLCNAGLGPWVPALRGALPCIVTTNVHGNDLVAPWVTHPGSIAEYQQAQVAGLSAADAVFCVSRFAAELALGRGVSANVVQTVENGVDTGRFRPGPRSEELGRRLGLARDDEVVLCVSRLAPRKGHHATLAVIARLAPRRPRLKLVYTGVGDGVRAELDALATALGIGERVIAAGFVSEAELPELYRLADVFTLLANGTDDDVEGFGVALLEAAASGLPTVASRTGGIPEAVVEGETGFLVPTGDVAAAADAIATLLADDELRRRLGARGRERATRSFSHTRGGEALLETWRRVFAQGPRRVVAAPVERSLFADDHGAALRWRSRARGDEMRRARAARRASLRSSAAEGRLVRLRATGEGARLLPDVLEDCAAVGVHPRVEVKLRRFVERDFVDHALTGIEGVELVHGVPHRHGASLLATLRALPSSALEKVRLVRIFLASEAALTSEHDRSLAAAVPEAYALRRLFAVRGVTVVPPPELMRYLSEQPAGGPETGMIEPTNLCNLACPTCPTGTGKIPPLPQMTLARFDRVIDQVAPRMRNLALWNYGEPLLNRALPEMIAHAKERGVKVVKVSSNVHFLDGDRGRALLGSGLDVLILSVDGATPESYATFRKEGDFAKVASSVAWLCREKKRLGLAKPRIELQFIAMRHNEHELPEIRRLAREWGVDRLRVKTVGADDAASRDLVPAERLLSRYREDGETPNAQHAFCTMAWDHTVVNVDGSVTPCCYLRPDMGPELVMGNVFETPFVEIWRGARYRAFRGAMLAGRASMPICNRCRGGTHDLLAAAPEDMTS